ncbi:MAG TPA: bifunctional 4-hydroxy-2-oxoglutarate aldolase/2-dehydro-3-deoxy-phosphogluconate aldolase [Planctomycetes bacterium]|nr:bifunctional 4-hydroxy-2-oxoglutarate aldolase/2-dehydro-3-deoxy-phosphogluconate aldolase [Planctomycetota bacterium]
MARFRRLDVYRRMIDIGIVPVFYHDDVDTAKKIVRACAAGGATAIEFTNRGDGAHLAFGELVRAMQKELPDVVLGIGSVIDGPTCALYIAAGANFIVGPMLSREAAAAANRRKIAYIPGCGSVTEISEAEALGAEIVKIFPGGQVGGPAFVKAVLGPCPWTSIMPTGGVEPTEENLSAWFNAGAACIGIGSQLIRKELVQAGDFETLARETAKVVQLVKKIRAGAGFALKK